jgi:NAD+ kinase
MKNGRSWPKLVIFGDPEKGPVAEAVDEFAEFVRDKAEVIASCSIEKCTSGILKNSDYAVVFGGDGSIISAARNLSEANVPVIGVNLGKLGFLAEFSISELKDLFGDIVRGQTSIEKRMMLSCEVVSASQKQKRRTAGEKKRRWSDRFRSTAVNDVFITAGPPFRMIELKLVVDGQSVATCVSDGLIISTPTGSTAYNLSAGGPILAGSMEAMVITPICPHSLSFRPIVISADSTAEVFGVRVNEGTTVSVDGQLPVKLTTDDVVRVQKDKKAFLVVNNPLRTRWDTLATKLNWAGKPRYVDSSIAAKSGKD